MVTKIPLGSGDLYMTEFTGTIPEDATFETEANKVGAIKNGATIAYSAETYEAIDDSGNYRKTVLTKETVTLSTGLFTWDGTTLEKLCSTARVTENASAGKRTVKIGGIANDNGKKYAVRFKHTDPVDGDIRVTIVGKNTSGLSIAFAPSTETTLGPTFTAQPSDSDGTLVIYEETIPSSQGGGQDS